jgi:spore coat protein A
MRGYLYFWATLLITAIPSLASADLTKYVDPLPKPPELRFPGAGPFEVTITENQFQTKLHRDLPAQNSWGYNGTSPGPTIHVQKGQTLRVHWKSELPLKHIYPLPAGINTAMPGMPGMQMPDVRTVTHLHGAVVSQTSMTDTQKNNDGWPDAWIVPGQEQISEYTNGQDAMPLWYHDHAMASTGRNVAAGLVGMYFVHDDYEASLNLPSGKYEIPLMLESKQLNADQKTLSYTNDIAIEFYGNISPINGKLWPYLDVEPRKYRFRFLNGSNARTYKIKLVNQADQSDGPAFYQIGSDGGFLQDTVVLNDPNDPDNTSSLDLAPAERADIIIDFSKNAGQNLVLANSERNPSENEPAIPELLLFKVGKKVSQPDTSALPLHFRPIPRMPESQATQTRQVVFNQMTMPDNSIMLTLNNKTWSDPITEKPLLGATEIWELINTLTDIHPFHIHLVQFQLLDRRLFDVANYLATGKIVFMADAMPPLPNEMGWKDTIKVYPQMVNRIIMRFAPFPGYYVYHCHILEHEDMDMMRPFQVVDPVKTKP